MENGKDDVDVLGMTMLLLWRIMEALENDAGEEDLSN